MTRLRREKYWRPANASPRFRKRLHIQTFYILSRCNQDSRSCSSTVAYRCPYLAIVVVDSSLAVSRLSIWTNPWEYLPPNQLELRVSKSQVEDLVQQLSCVLDEVKKLEEIFAPFDDRQERVSNSQTSPEIGKKHHGDVISVCGLARSVSPGNHGDVIQMHPEVNLAALLHKMLTAQPNIYSKKLPRDVDQDNYVYRKLRRERRNLVLDSVCPDLAPHIVITPPPYSEEDYFISSQNSTAPQWPGYLMVPPLPPYLMSPAHWLSLTEPRNSKVDERSSLTVGMISDNYPSPSRAVFSRSKFAIGIERSSAERLILCHVVGALHRRQRKACAFAASIVALSFRSRYDSPDFEWKSEKLFSWIDAAEPLLLINRYYRGTTIIDSPCPFLAPHIIINEAPPLDPWVRWQNATYDPQDHGRGRYLTVPSRFVDFVNEPDEYDALPPSDTADLSDESPPDTPPPATPSPTDQEQMTFANDGCEGEISTKDLSGPLTSTYADTRLSHDLATTHPSSDIFADEENDLPPFDDWYTSVVERLGLTV